MAGRDNGNMQHFSLQLEAMSPMAIRADHAPGGVENATYISGTTLLGSLAALHRLAHPDDTSTFERLFLSGQVQYPDLYPASFRHDDFDKASNFACLSPAENSAKLQAIPWISAP